MPRPPCYADGRNTLRRKPASLRALRRYGHFFTSRARACVRVWVAANVHFSPVREIGRNGVTHVTTRPAGVTRIARGRNTRNTPIFFFYG